MFMLWDNAPIEPGVVGSVLHRKRSRPWDRLSKNLRSHGWRSRSATRTCRKERFLESLSQGLPDTKPGSLGPRPNDYTHRKTLAPKQPQRLSFQAEHQTGNPNAETVPVQRQRRQNRKTRNRFPGLLPHGQTLADPPAL